MISKRNRTFSAICAAAAAVFALQSSAVQTSASFGSTKHDTDSVKIVIDTERDRKSISRFIYGINDDYSISDTDVYAVKKSGTALSSYNWEINTANMGADGGFENSYGLVSEFGRNVLNTPALVVNSVVNKATLYDIPSRYVTLQMMGYAAKDAFGEVEEDNSAERWAEVKFNKDSELLNQPDIHDDAVYMDEYVSFLVNKYGFASDGGINGYFLDSEPESWKENYSVLGLEAITPQSLVSRSALLSETVKNIDPSALVYGPSIKGIEAYVSLKNPEIWSDYSKNYSWFIDYYLDKMREASEQKGTRLLDVLDLHFITEAQSVLLEPVIGTDTKFANDERMQAVRVLWDSDYTENSPTAIYYKQFTPLIPTIQASIRMYYPGTKLSFSEYNFGGGNHISGGIAQVDALGVFGEQDVYMAALKPDKENYPYQKSGINLFTNYDGDGAGYGNTAVYADNGGDSMSSVYASVNAGREGSLRAILINKNNYAEKTADVTINCDTEYHSAKVYSFNEESPEIVLSDVIEEIDGNSFEFDMEPLTVYLFEFDGSTILEEEPADTDITEDTEETVQGSEPEHVEVTSVPENAVTEKPEVTAVTEITEVPEDEKTETVKDTSASAETAVTEVSGDAPAETSAQTTEDVPPVVYDPEEEKTVPKGIKIAVSLLVGAVVVYMLIIIVKEYFITKKDK